MTTLPGIPAAAQGAVTCGEGGEESPRVRAPGSARRKWRLFSARSIRLRFPVGSAPWRADWRRSSFTWVAEVVREGLGTLEGVIWAGLAEPG